MFVFINKAKTTLIATDYATGLYFKEENLSSGPDQLLWYHDDESIYNNMYSNVYPRIDMYINKHQLSFFN